MAQDRPKQPAYEIFSVQRSFQQFYYNLSSLSSRRQIWASLQNAQSAIGICYCYGASCSPPQLSALESYHTKFVHSVQQAFQLSHQLTDRYIRSLTRLFVSLCCVPYPVVFSRPIVVCRPYSFIFYCLMSYCCFCLLLTTWHSAVPSNTLRARVNDRVR